MKLSCQGVPLGAKAYELKHVGYALALGARVVRALAIAALS
jgi:hypothetical protein